MSVKSEIKMGILNDQGVKIEDQLEAAYKRQAAYDGAKQALRLIAKEITGLTAQVDKDAEDGKLSFNGTSSAVTYVKAMLDRAANMALSAATLQENTQISIGGEINAYKMLMGSLQKEINSEKIKLKALLDAVSSSEPAVEQKQPPNPAEPSDAHPGPGIASIRKVEAHVQAKEASAVAGAKKARTAKPKKKKRE